MKTVLVYNDQGFTIMNWVADGQIYNASKFFAIPNLCRLDFLFDGTIITEDDLGNLRQFHINNSTLIDVKFGTTDPIGYTGVDVDVSLLVNSYSLAGARVVSTVNLALDGNAVFKGTGTKAVSLETNNSSDSTVVVTVTGPGVINVVPTQG